MDSNTTEGPNGQRRARWDFFISHASEDKATVARPLYDELIARGHTVWLDQAALTVGDSLRRRIDDGLVNCRFGIVVISQAFLRKNWPQYELDGLIDRQMSEGTKVVLPVWHGVGHDEVARHSPSLAGVLAATTEWGVTPVADQIIEAFRSAITLHTGVLTPQSSFPEGQTSWTEPLNFPLGDKGRAQLLRERPDFWEYYLFADALARGLTEHDAAWQDHQLGLVRPTGHFVGSADIPNYVRRVTSQASAMVGNVERLTQAAVWDSAVGLPGQPGDPIAIEHLARHIMAIYGYLLDWAANVRSTQVPTDFERLLDLLSRFVDRPILQFRDFVAKCTASIGHVPLLAGNAVAQPMVLRLDMTLTIDDAVKRAYDKEFRRLKRGRKFQ